MPNPLPQLPESRSSEFGWDKSPQNEKTNLFKINSIHRHRRAETESKLEEEDDGGGDGDAADYNVWYLVCNLILRAVKKYCLIFIGELATVISREPKCDFRDSQSE